MRGSLKKWFLSILLVLAVLVAAPSSVQASTSSADIDTAWDSAVSYSYEHPAELNTFWPWVYALALGSQGEELVSSVVINPSVASPTALANSIIGVLGQREDPTRVMVGDQEVNLVTQLKDTQDVASGRFGSADATLNNTLWAVIALDMYNRHYPTNPVSYEVNQAISYIKSKQSLAADDPLNPYGSFNESGSNGDADSTAHALVALANHVAADDAVVQNALAFLQTVQNDQGRIDYISYYEGTCYQSDSSASTATVIEALLALGLNPQSEAWTKNGNTLIDGMLAHQQPDGRIIDDAGGYSVDNTVFALGALGDLHAGSSKYRGIFPLPSTSNRIISVTPAFSLSAGQDCDLTVKVRNGQATTQDTLVIAALYNPVGQMVTYSYGQYNLGANTTQTVGLGFAVTTAAGSQVKVMAWDNWQNKTPLCSPITIPVQ